MFEIRCLVGDRSLSKALHALRGLTLEPPVTVPLNAEDTDGNPQAGKSSVVLATEFLTKDKREEVTAKELSGYLMENGLSRNGYSYALKTLLEKGLLKKHPTKQFTYKVVK